MDAGAQALLGNDGACPEVEHDGRVWRVGHPVQKAKAVLEELAVAAAVRETMALRPILPPAEFETFLKRLESQIRAGEFRTWGPGWAAFVTGPGGGVAFLLSLLRCHHPAATEADARGLLAARPEEVRLALDRVVPGFFDDLAATLPPGLPPGAVAAARGAMTGAFRAGPTPTATT